jgi:hypothetical protein
MVDKRLFPTNANSWLLALVISLVGLALVAMLAFAQGSAEPVKSKEGRRSAAPAKRPAEAKPAAAVHPLPAKNLVTNIPAYDGRGAEYVLLAWSDFGMRMASDWDQYFSLGPPLVNLRAQLIKRGAGPTLVTKDVKLVYAVEGVAQPSTKSRYWEFSQALSGQKLAPDKGPSGNGQRGEMQAADKLFNADGIPLMPYAADGSFLPYPTVTVEARDAASGRVLALTRAVLPVTTQLGCAKCHGGDKGGPGLSGETAANILSAHDKNSGSKLLAEAKAGHPRACAECHGADKKEMSVSASLHGFHAAKIPGLGAESCGFCHPSVEPTSYFRGVHHQRGLDCSRCHGLLEDHALGLLKGEQAAGKKEDADRLMAKLKPRAGEMPARTAWVMEPDCNGCHDLVTRPKPDAIAFGKWNKDAGSIYHQRRDQTMGLACSACHGPPHAIYPAQNPYGRDRDNIQPVQYMGRAKSMGAAGTCGVCHLDLDAAKVSAHHPIPEPKGTTVAMLAGFESRMPGVRFPHQAHADQDCRTCHHKGYVDGQSLSCSTSGCHDQSTGDTQARYFRNAFHGQGSSCNYCHQQRRKAGQASGPVECGGCHVIAR